MIQDLNSEQLSGFRELVRDLQIFSTRRGIAAGMVMDKDYRRGCIPNRRSEDFAWMNQTRVERSDCDAVGLDWLVLCVEGDDVEFFLNRVLSQSIEVGLTITDSFSSARDADGRNGLRSLGHCNSASEFDSRHDLSVARFGGRRADLLQIGHAASEQIGKPRRESVGNLLCTCDGRFFWDANANQDGKKVRVGQIARAHPQQSFARPLLRRGLLDLQPMDLLFNPLGRLEFGRRFSKPTIAKTVHAIGRL